MIDPNNPDDALDDFSDLPIQPTGSGVADLEVAYEQMKLGNGEDTQVVGDADDVESEAHPS